MVELRCSGWEFLSNFDSGNIGTVEAVDPKDASKHSLESTESLAELPDFEFNIWTRPDCAGTEFENGNRTWFYFGMREGVPFSLVKINIVNLNKQCKIYSQGMTPVYKILPGKVHWERIKDKPVFNMEDKQFTVSFLFKFGDTRLQTVYFAFTYPYTYTDLQTNLAVLDNTAKSRIIEHLANDPKQDDIYYHRELLTYTLEKRRIDLITISSFHGITKLREPRPALLFPDSNKKRPFKYQSSKKVIFLSARVHPGETPSSYVMSGMMNFLMSRDDPVAIALRKNFVFKIIPMLNPDGVFRGNYRTDTRGINLNRVYGNPSPILHPSIYSARTMIRYYHHGMEVPDTPAGDGGDNLKLCNIEDQVSGLSLSKKLNESFLMAGDAGANYRVMTGPDSEVNITLEPNLNVMNTEDGANAIGIGPVITPPEDSGLYMYIDMHGHTSKKGIFMYGNHFEDMNAKVECMLFPKLITLYSQHFLFDSCNFTERNMYVRDRRDGSSREGCGRVGVYKATGLVRSYTLECNYNTGKSLNSLPPSCRESVDRKLYTNYIVPPKYTPALYEEVGKSILSALPDLVGKHPNSRLINSMYKNLDKIRIGLQRQIVKDEFDEASLELQDETNSETKKILSKKCSNKKVGKSILSAVLDLVGVHPNTRLANSSFRNLSTIRDLIRNRLLMEEIANNDPDSLERKKISGRLSARKMRAVKCESRGGKLARLEGNSRSGGGGPRRFKLVEKMGGSCEGGGVMASSSGAAPVASGGGGGRRTTRKTLDKVKKKQRTGLLREEGRRLEKKCSPETRRLTTEHRRKKLKPK